VSAAAACDGGVATAAGENMAAERTRSAETETARAGSGRRVESMPTGSPRTDAPLSQAAMLLSLQRTAGNRAVAGLVAQVAERAPRSIQRLQTVDEWIAATTPSETEEKRSSELKEIDKKLRAYEKARRKDELEAAMEALKEVDELVAAWRRAAGSPDLRSTTKEKREAAEALGAKTVKYWQQFALLQREVHDEMNQLTNELSVQAVARKKRDAEKQADKLIPKKLKGDVNEKALELFRIFMKHFRGKVTYTTTTQKDVSIWDASGSTACGTNSSGLVELLQRAGLKAKVVELTKQYFVTKPLGGSFIDPSAPGNLSGVPGETQATRRYFFSKHFIVAVTGGPMLDPTSGVVTDAAGKDVVDTDYQDFEPTRDGYENREYKVAVVGKDDRGGSLYAMSALKGA
jgi:hypothetical protein